MPIDTIYLLRHGLRLDWDTPDWTNITGVPNDTPLNDLGKAQSDEVAHYLKQLPITEQPTTILSSPSFRCLQTVQPTARALGLPIRIDHGLAEWWSTVKTDGTVHPDLPKATALLPFVAEIDPTWISTGTLDRKGETQEELYNRCIQFSSALFPQLDLETENHTHMLLVGHVAPLIALIRVLIGDKIHPLSLGCSSITILRKTEDDRWQADCFGSGAHLEKGSLKPWGFHDMGLL